MRFGSMNFPVKPVIEEIGATAAMGMDFIELAMDPPCAHFSQLLAQKQTIATALERNRLGLVCHLPTFVYTAHLSDRIRQASIQEMIDSLEAAATLGAEKAIVHPGYIDGLAVYVLDHALERAMDSLDQIVRRAVRLGVPLCIENMFSRLGPFVEPDDFDAVFQVFPELNLVLDTGHANLNDTTNHRAVDFISRFGDRLNHVHISDNLGTSDDHMPVGHGTVPFDAVFDALKSLGYDGTFTLEIFGDDRSAIQASRRALETLLM